MAQRLLEYVIRFDEMPRIGLLQTAFEPSDERGLLPFAHSVGRTASDSFAELVDHVQHAIILLDPLLWRECQHFLNQRDVDLGARELSVLRPHADPVQLFRRILDEESGLRNESSH